MKGGFALSVIVLSLGPFNCVAAQDAKTPSDKWPMFDPNALKNSRRFWTDAQLLYWESSMGSLDYGVESKSSTAIHHGHSKEGCSDPPEKDSFPACGRSG